MTTLRRRTYIDVIDGRKYGAYHTTAHPVDLQQIRVRHHQRSRFELGMATARTAGDDRVAQPLVAALSWSNYKCRYPGCLNMFAAVTAVWQVATITRRSQKVACKTSPSFVSSLEVRPRGANTGQRCSDPRDWRASVRLCQIYLLQSAIPLRL